MSSGSLPAVILACISAAVGAYHVIVFLPGRARREDLMFGALCMTVAVYDVLSALLYSSVTPEQGVIWQRWQLLTLSLGAIVLALFVGEYSRKLSRIARVAITSAFAPVVYASLFAPSWLWTSTPLLKTTTLPFRLGQITYYEMAPGPGTYYFALVVAVYFVVLFLAGVRQYRTGDRDRALPLLISISVFFAGVANDFAVAANIYSSVYLVEFAFLALVALMAFSLSRELLRATTVKAALDVSESRFRAIVEASTDWIWEVDELGRYTYSSPKVQDILGFTPEDLIGKTPFDLMPSAEARRVRRLFDRRARRKDPIVMLENVNIRKDGKEVVLETSGIPILGPEGELLGYRGIDRDITENKRAFEALMESEDRFHALADNVQGIIYVCRNNERLSALFLNDAVEALTGFSKEEFLEDHVCLAELCHPEDRDRVISQVSKAIGADKPYQLLYRIRDRGGGWRWVEDIGLGVVHPDHDVLLEGYLTDVTARQRAEEALRESEERYRNLIQASPNAVLLLSPSGEIQFANPSAVSLVGAGSESALVGKQISDFMPIEARSRIAKRIEGIFEGSAPSVTFDDTLKRLDATPVFVSVSIVKVVFEGLPALLMVGTDLTENKMVAAERERLENQLRHAQKMEAVGRLAGGVAHDFNNLLQAILSHTQTLRQTATDPDRLAAGLAELEERTRQGAQLTRQLLLFSRRESTKPERLDLQGVVQGTARLVRRLVREDLHLEIDRVSGPTLVEADRGQLEQVIMNLALNAADAMPKGGRIHIQTGRDLDRVWFSVSDTGHGIAAEIRDQIFEPFFTTKAPGEGSGLGLSVVHGIVSSHGGEIVLDTNSDGGSTFRVTLPSVDAEPSGTRPVARPSDILDPGATGRGEKILLVEDDPATREALQSILDLLGFEVESAASGTEAREKAEETAFDLVLTDYLLPDCRGNELAVDLQPENRDLPVVLMSGYTQNADVREEVASGSVAFLQKPFDMDTLARELRAALDGLPTTT